MPMQIITALYGPSKSKAGMPVYSDGTTGQPHIDFTELRHRLDGLAGLLKGIEADNSLDAREERAMLHQLCEYLGSINVELAKYYGGKIA